MLILCTPGLCSCESPDANSSRGDTTRASEQYPLAYSTLEFFGIPQYSVSRRIARHLSRSGHLCSSARSLRPRNPMRADIFCSQRVSDHMAAFKRVFPYRCRLTERLLHAPRLAHLPSVLRLLVHPRWVASCLPRHAIASRLVRLSDCVLLRQRLPARLHACPARAKPHMVPFRGGTALSHLAMHIFVLSI